MINYLKKERWSPYAAGTLIGTLLTLLIISGYYLGASTGIARIGALFTHALFPVHVKNTSYFASLLQNQILFDWKLLFIVGVFFGAFLSARLSGHKQKEAHIWQQTQGPSKTRRAIMAFIGGTILLFGARLANGCTSGHAITGASQLSVVSWVFMMGIFATGIPIAMLLYRNKKCEVN